MSVASVNTNFSLYAKNCPQPPSSKSFHEWVLFDPQEHSVKNIFWSRIWTVAMYTTMVAFTALAVSAAALTLIYAEPYFPLTLAAIMFVGLQWSTGVLQWMYSKSEHYAEKAAKIEKILVKYKQLNEKKIDEKLASLGITKKDIVRLKNHPSSLRFLIARFEAFKEIQSLLEKTAEDCTKPTRFKTKETKIVEIRPENINAVEHGVSNFRDAQEILEKRETFLQQAAICNLQAAYVLKILQNPYEKEQSEHFEELYGDSFVHIIAGYYQNPSAHDMILTKKDKRIFTRDQIRAMDTVKLAQEIYGFKKNPS